MDGVLYHYTSAKGLEGIVDGVTRSSFPKIYQEPGTHALYSTYSFDRTLRLEASDVRCMNDTSELGHAGEVYAARLEAAAKERPGLLNDLAEGLKANEFRPDPGQVFAACFSPRADDVDQWRCYAEGTGGFAIGVPREVLQKHTYPLFNYPEPQWEFSYPPDVTLKKVSYSPDAIVSAADRFVETVKRSGDRPSALPWLRFQLAGELAAFKNPAFEREEEWRAFTHTMPPTHSPTPLFEEAKDGRFGRTPFTSFAVNMGTGWKPAAGATIADLVVGPGPDQRTQVSAAKELLIRNGHDASVVRGSDVPLRG
ncbi:DUF2971 domain-containing protein [Mycolicibacterium sp. S3B2]|uniref:DUF2971 domain-containing protein n=1 Tax=Mycolicibacterium sp. S3B2 TaxID=3415120 RepID=UPI003C7DA591